MRTLFIAIIFALVCSISPAKAYDVGTVTTCSGLGGGTAGFESTEVCFSGGGEDFCAGGPSASYTYVCAGAALNTDKETDINWIEFDPPEDYSEEDKEEYYTYSTRDADRGRSGKNNILFMNQFNICRAIDNRTATSGSVQPVFIGARTEAEWRTIHGVADGANPNGGYSEFANDSSIGPKMSVCCAPQVVTICEMDFNTGYAIVGDTVEISTVTDYGTTAYGAFYCASNNTFQPVAAFGVCSGSGGGGGGTPSGGGMGYSNPTNGGTISAADAAAHGVPAGYNEVDQSVSTNAQGMADMAAAQADQEAEAEAAEAAEAAAQAAAAAAEAAAAEAESESESGGEGTTP